MLTRENDHRFGKHLQTDRANELFLQAVHGAFLLCGMWIPQRDTHCTVEKQKHYWSLGIPRNGPPMVPQSLKNSLANIKDVYSFWTTQSHWACSGARCCPQSFFERIALLPSWQSTECHRLFLETPTSRVVMLTCPYMKMSWEGLGSPAVTTSETGRGRPIPPLNRVGWNSR